jgi:hypothetical protein
VRQGRKATGLQVLFEDGWVALLNFSIKGNYDEKCDAILYSFIVLS